VNSPPATRRTHRVWLWLAASALVIVVAAIVIGPETLIVRLFGPPAVVLEERFPRRPGGPTVDHSGFDALLRRHVDATGNVDYDGLAKDAAQLDAYLEVLANAPALTSLDRNEVLALLINAYNAFTLRLILDHLPLASIRDIPADQRWDARRWTVAGRRVSLTMIEHDYLRADFVEPRIHFAINCASVGCPPLRRGAFTAKDIDAQLDEQARRVHGDRRWFVLDTKTGTLHLTEIYRWYEGDFVQVAGSVLAYAARYSQPLAARLEAGAAVAIEWIDYDWSLNQSK